MSSYKPKGSGDSPPPSALETPPGRPVDEAPRSFGLAPEPDIPELKKKEEEKKGGGVPGYVGSGSGSSGLGFGVSGGARVGSSLAANPGFLGSGRIAAALANFFGGRATLLGGLFAGRLGAPLVLAGLAGWAMVLGAAALKLLGGAGPDGGISNVMSSLPVVGQSGIVIDKPRDRSLGYLADANQGEIAWDKDAPKEAPKEEEQVQEAKAEVQTEVPKFEMPDVNALMGQKGGLDKGFVKGLSNSPNAAGGGAPALANGAGFNMQKSLGGSSFKPRDLGAGRAKAMERARKKLASKRLSTMGGRSSRAMGQLKLARNMSTSGAKTSVDTGARQYTTDAFEQGKSIGGELSGIEGGGVVVPPGTGLGTGANDVSPPAVGPSGNVTPYQDNVDNAKNMGNNSAMLKMIGMMMIALGLMLIASGTILKGNHTTFPIGVALVLAGTALVALGAAMLGMSGQQADAAKQQGDVVEKQYGQDDQADVVDDCADQATNDGTKTEACQPGRRPEQFNRTLRNNTVQQDVAAERDATYTLDDGGKAGGRPLRQQRPVP